MSDGRTRCTVLHVAPAAARRRQPEVIEVYVHTTLPRRFYADPDFYRAELERFYFNRWICAGRADQIPNAGDYFTRTLGDESVIVTRDGQARSTPCSTSAVIAARGCANSPRGISPIASSARITTGPTASTDSCSPRRTCRRNSAKDDYPLHRAGCEVWDGNVFVHLGAAESGSPGGHRAYRTGSARSARDLPSASRAWRMGELRLGRRIVYDVKANWKLIVLNYNECLHCPNLHPALNRLHHYLGADNVAPTAVLLRRRDGISRGRRDNEHGRQAPARYLPGSAKRSASRSSTTPSTRTCSSACTPTT